MGKRITIHPNFIYVFSRHLNSSVEYEYDRIKFPKAFSAASNGLFQTSFLRIILSYFISTKFSVKMLSQYDEMNNAVSSNLRIRLNPQEGTDLYIVFNQGLNTNRTSLKPNLPVINSQAIIIKYLKTFTL